MSRTVLRARWVMPVSGPPIDGGRVVIERDRIVAVGPAQGSETDAIDFGDAVILPGFVNAHTHLELTGCGSRVPFDGSFVAWVERLASLYPGDDTDAQAALRQWVRDGLDQLLAAGVTTVADIGSGPPVLDAWCAAPINVVGFLEVLGMGPRRTGDHTRSIARAPLWAEQARDRFERDSSCVSHHPLRRVGFSPHAPYSTDTSVYRDVIALAGQADHPLCTHLAETRDELQFLADGTGPFRELLERRGLWDGSFEVPGCSPVDYAQQLGLFGAASLLVHVNYADDADLDRIADAGKAVVYCPRSHAFFGHEPHRFGDMLARGIDVCLGTDSLASNDSLSILDELRFLRTRDEAIPGDRLLTMGTQAGARALGLEAEVGSLESGKRADLVVVPLTDPHAADAIDDLLRGQTQPAAVYAAGRRAWSPRSS